VGEGLPAPSLLALVNHFKGTQTISPPPPPDPADTARHDQAVG